MCKFTLKFIRLLTVSNLFTLEDIQKCQRCQLCVVRENSHMKSDDLLPNTLLMLTCSSEREYLFAIKFQI